MSKQHLDGFAMAARSFESLGLGQGTSHVASILIHIARTAFWFEHVGAAVRQRRQVTERMIGADMAGRGEHFASWAEIMFRSWSNLKSSCEKVPSSRFDLSMTGMCGAIFFSLTIQLSASADP